MVFLNSVGFLPAEPGTLRNNPGWGAGGGSHLAVFRSLASDLETSHCSILPFPTALPRLSCEAGVDGWIYNEPVDSPEDDAL